jgi:hypothetical protein
MTDADFNVLGEQASQYILNFAVWDLARGVLLLFLVLYLIFALLVVRQINLLNSVVGTHFSPLFRMVALLHVLLAVGVLVFALMVL